MTAVEMMRAIRDAETDGDFEAAARLREQVQVEPPPALWDLGGLTDSGLEQLSDAVAFEMMRRMTAAIDADDPQAMTIGEVQS